MAHRNKKIPEDLPKFTYGLEGKLISLIGEPILLAQRVVRPKFETELSTNDGPGCVRYTYHTQRHTRLMNLGLPSPFLWKEQEDIFMRTLPIIHRVYTFRADLWEDSEGKLKQFSFALQVT